jgi:Cupin domain
MLAAALTLGGWTPAPSPLSRRTIGSDQAVIRRRLALAALLALRYSSPAMDLEIVNFDSPTEVRTFEKGRFELYAVGPTTLGRATYEPGWKWSKHVGPSTGEISCQVEHVGLVLSGQAVVQMDEGREIVMRAGDFFYVPAGHDSWVVGDEPYVSLHTLGSQDYALPDNVR